MGKRWHMREGAIFAEFKVEQGKLVRTMRQPNEDFLLGQNAEIQKSPEALRRLDWGQWLGRIPTNVYHFLKKRYPEIAAPDAHVRTEAWLKLLNHRDYERLRVRARKLARRTHGKQAARELFPKRLPHHAADSA